MRPPAAALRVYHGQTDAYEAIGRSARFPGKRCKEIIRGQTE